MIIRARRRGLPRFQGSELRMTKPGVIVFALAAFTAGAQTIAVELDYGRPVLQIQAGDGGSVCQFHGSDPAKGTISADRAYSTLRGFPDDGPETEFGKFCDVAFSTRGAEGMGLSQIWSTPSIFQSPPGSLTKRYDSASWTRLDFSMYEPEALPPNRYTAKSVAHPRGHTVAMLQAALRRARREGERMLIWNDMHTDYPHWMWKDQLRSNPIPEKYWEEAALHVVYYAKYLAARHGIPVHTVSLQNEPDLPGRHAFTPEMLLRMSRILRARLDEAGLYGVRILPYTSVGLNDVRLDWRNVTVRTLSETFALLNGPMAAYRPYIDALGGHLSQSEEPFPGRLPNTQFWRASGDADNHWKGHGSVSFNMGPDDQIDEVIRLNTYLYGKGVSLAGIWQIALRMGHTEDNFVLPERFNVGRDFRHAAVDGAAVVYQHLRPGMFLVAGSMGNNARAPYSVDGFGGRGHREVAVITNSGAERNFRVALKGAADQEVEVYQATAFTRKQSLGRRKTTDGAISIRVPADSVTSLVSVTAHTRKQVVLVVAEARRLSAREIAIRDSLASGYDVEVVPERLSEAEQDALQAKRHPVDPMGTAVYVLSDSVGEATALAHRTVMAPVVAIGERNRVAIGVARGGLVDGGAALDFRHPLDPPASLLRGGRPLACGARAHWHSAQKPGKLRGLVDKLAGRG